MANERIEIKRERRDDQGEGVIVVVPRDVMEFCLSHPGVLSVMPENGGVVILHEVDGTERRLEWAEVGTEMPPAS